MSPCTLTVIRVGVSLVCREGANLTGERHALSCQDLSAERGRNQKDNKGKTNNRTTALEATAYTSRNYIYIH